MMLRIVMHDNSHQIIKVGEKFYYFSYATCVAFADFSKGTHIRRKSDYSNTTARHMSNMGVKGWDAVEDDVFEQIAYL